ncbi:FAD-dependent oxidoreductase [Alisedimentitalea sp. MJ-SS2]|uniref:FAD-dependent oxidoreductase n=1 Tax=Aliisedimentitalea sp. MJ-SS2 TaxID=3049795 RepID=UPI0029120E53|nr:FAD-dependent oxidoreductase [Alisedimentitalea sp. MJ-SS2]MDU8926257.1 FAD-dependent oxidoreductase [Alisedimentitalea sp. MJ-SS2]
MADPSTPSPDVLVIGGGTAGFGAALAAARHGYSTCLIEAGQKVGGVMSACPGMPWGAAYPCGTSVGGLMKDLSERLFTMQPPAAEKRPCTLDNFGPEILYDPEIATLTMFDMLEVASIDLRLGTLALDPEMDGNRIKSVRVADRHGLQSIKPGIVIDCSGDGDISAKAGVPYRLGDASGAMMGVTLTFLIEGADWTRVFAENDPYFTAHAARGIASGRLHPDLSKLYLMKGFHAGTVFCNSVVIRDVDGTNPANVTRATQEGRRRCHALSRFLIDEVPGFETACMTQLGPTVGVRETRKLEGLYQITGTDLARATKFRDGVVACDNPVDDVMRSDSTMTHDAIVADGAYYTIPFRALVPRRISNLLFAGRIVSADDVAFASVRGMPQCMAMGQATGTAAAMALQDGIPVQGIDTEALVTNLQAQGLRGLGDDRLSPQRP